jgi:hypothetical protein
LIKSISASGRHWSHSVHVGPKFLLSFARNCLDGRLLRYSLLEPATEFYADRLRAFHHVLEHEAAIRAARVRLLVLLDPLAARSSAVASNSTSACDRQKVRVRSRPSLLFQKLTCQKLSCQRLTVGLMGFGAVRRERNEAPHGPCHARA